MPARVAEDVGEQPARAVDDRGLLREALHARDEPEHGEHAFDAIEVAELGVQHRERVQRAPARRLGALLDAEIEAERSRVDQLAVVVARQLARRARPATVDDHRVERVVRRVGPRQARARARSSRSLSAHAPSPSAQPRPPARCCRYAGVSHACGKWPRLVENTRPCAFARSTTRAGSRTTAGARRGR